MSCGGRESYPWQCPTFEPPAQRDDLARIADALERIANVLDDVHDPKTQTIGVWS